MRHELPIGTVNLPEDWEDQTTYQFVSPSMKLDVPLAAGMGMDVQASRISLALSRIELTDDNMPFSIENQANELRGAMPNFRQVSKDPWTHPKYGDIPTLEFTFDLAADWIVHQVQLYFNGPNDAERVCLALSCEAGRQQQCRPTLKQVFEGFELPA